ncbi:MAG: glycosyltransferase family 4 protein [Planctomycetota bacterium]
MSRRIWIVSEIYYPEETSTGYFLTGIAEGLAHDFDVSVLCGQPNYFLRGTRAPSDEMHNGVRIHRCSGTTFSKDSLSLRIVNLVTISLSIFLRALLSVRKNDAIIVVTNPPLLPFIMTVVCRLRRAKCVLLVHDVYPEVLVTTGLTARHSLVFKLITCFCRGLFRNVDHIIALGRDMKKLIENKAGKAKTAISIIENWGDIENIAPGPRNENPLLTELGLTEKFVVQYSGNIGRTHSIENLVAAARSLKDQDDIVFLVIGAGAKKQWLDETIRREKIVNIMTMPRQERDNLRTSLNACDLAIIPFVSGMSGVSVPSRIYNILAAGKPILAVAQDDSEPAMVVEEEDIGWVVKPDDVDGIVNAILQAKSAPQRLAEMGTRARAAVERKYSYAHILGQYRALIESIP